MPESRRAAAVFGEELFQLCDDSLAEDVSRPRERERHVGVEALQPERARGTPDAELERRAVVAAGAPGREHATDLALLIARSLDARPECRIGGCQGTPALTPPAASSRETAATACGHVR